MGLWGYVLVCTGMQQNRELLMQLRWDETKNLKETSLTDFFTYT